MYKFDVRYTEENYFEYYKDVLINQKILKNLLFTVIFAAIAVWWWIDSSDNTAGNGIAIFALVMGALMPVSSFLMLPLLKKQLAGKRNDIDATHIEITFNEDDVIYENLTVAPETLKVEKPEVNPNEPKAEQTESEEKDNKEAIEPEKNEEEKIEEEKTQKVFTLHYNNFYQVRATKNLVTMSLDKQTVIIIPLSTITLGNAEDFIRFLSTKIEARRFNIKLPKSSGPEM